MDWILDVGPVGMFLITSIGGFVLYLLTKAVVKAPGTVLQTKFMALGTLTGKTYDEIVEVCGAPNSTSTSISADGLAIRICQWLSAGFHIVLLFDENNICLGISSETSV